MSDYTYRKIIIDRDGVATGEKIVNVPDEVVKQIRADAIDEVSRAMYHQCFECDNSEDMQKWDSGNWFRYKLFENVIEQLEEQSK